MYALADCNNFFVSCERVFRPDLNGKPVIVLSNNDGCAVARSNEAKALGIKMGVPLFKIRHLVEKHGVIVFSGNMALYGDMSRRVRLTLQEFAPSLEVYSIDEVFLDLHGMQIEDLSSYAREISRICLRNTGIPVSIGISPTKTLAKIASKLCKQYPKLQGGCYMHRPEDIEKVLRKFPVEDVWGIGRKTTPKLYQRGIRTAFDFVKIDEERVRRLMGITGVRTHRELRGIPSIKFEDSVVTKQSICVSSSFSKEITDCKELCSQVANFAAKAAEKLRGQGSVAFEMMVFAMTNRFRENMPQAYKSILVPFVEPTGEQRTIVAAAVAAIRELFDARMAYKKAGVVITRLEQRNQITGSLFEDSEAAERESRISYLIDSINQQYGHGSIRIGVQGDGSIHKLSEHRSPHYTTLWSDIPTASL